MDADHAVLLPLARCLLPEFAAIHTVALEDFRVTLKDWDEIVDGGDELVIGP